jgi:hypothetical protein
LKTIETELGDIDEDTKRSILQEIEGHLNEKIDEIKKAKKISKISPKKLKKVLEDFGEPKELADEYRRQISDAGGEVAAKKEAFRKKVILPVTVVTIVILLIIILIMFMITTHEPEGLEDKTIIPGEGLDAISIGDDLDTITDILGKPDDEVEVDDLLWVDYKRDHGLDFLLTKDSKRIIEIRFNPGFDGALENGIKLGSSLGDVLNKSGEANKVVDANLSETQRVLLGSDKVLYNQYYDGELTAYKFIDSKNGILFWFSSNQELIQIVVFSPY